MASSDGEMYNRSPPPGVGFCKIGVDDTAAFISAKVFSHSSLHWNLSEPCHEGLEGFSLLLSDVYQYN